MERLYIFVAVEAECVVALLIGETAKYGCFARRYKSKPCTSTYRQAFYARSTTVIKAEMVSCGLEGHQTTGLVWCDKGRAYHQVYNAAYQNHATRLWRCVPSLMQHGSPAPRRLCPA